MIENITEAFIIIMILTATVYLITDLKSKKRTIAYTVVVILLIVIYALFRLNTGVTIV